MLIFFSNSHLAPSIKVASLEREQGTTEGGTGFIFTETNLELIFFAF
ncbi:hypothetical protein CWATWH8502_1431 [Crocosphaera watsonii WH 8502]|uniref:UDP-glucose dehydrogenase n=3 Tax=Crocosphaera watsonii TaxID=263511 RepID=T2JYJ1_CROWT|nr:hypothetical protein CWATWH8502_1431 [Crocosphaera watsonii WH 8502]CCQ56388.1 hypothetical protein CWATWH0005_72 [Crocosphaera watsonii WH 0005]CCQ70833.1 UDP-glucose dehydrogenase [Crocosphaera watsonii WH 0402]